MGRLPRPKAGFLRLGGSRRPKIWVTPNTTSVSRYSSPLTKTCVMSVLKPGL